MQHATDPQIHLVQVPGVARLRSTPAQLPGELGTEPLAPLPDALVADYDAPLSQDQLDVPKAEAEQVVEPDRVADDLSSPAPRLSGTPRRRTVSAGGVDDGGRDDGCGRSRPGRADVAAAQAGSGAAPAARCGPGYGVAGVPGPRGAAHLLAGTPLGPRAGGIAAGSEM